MSEVLLKGVGCGVWGVGCGVWTVGCGLWVVGCGLWDVGCWVQVWEVRVEGSGFRLQF